MQRERDIQRQGERYRGREICRGIAIYTEEEGDTERDREI